jgi:hypothetical protein
VPLNQQHGFVLSQNGVQLQTGQFRRTGAHNERRIQLSVNGVDGDLTDSIKAD